MAAPDAGDGRAREDGGREGGRRPRARADRSRGVYMISIAAELAGMHPQTLRIYETRGLITPKRSPKNTRLYSQEDVERLQRIQELTTELGLNLAGVETVLRLQDEVQRLRVRMERLERQMREEVQRVHKQYRRDLVLYRDLHDPRPERTRWTSRSSR
jgi:MerR family transcriptional regulator, heat shock protein HspR